MSNKKHSRITLIRGACALLAFFAIGLGLAFSLDIDTISPTGFGIIGTLCPLGALESMLGAKAFLPRAAITFCLLIAAVVIFGKAFCSWVCPIPHLSNLFRSKKSSEKIRSLQHESATKAIAAWEQEEKEPGGKNGRPRREDGMDTRHAILGGAIISTAIFGFPVFCLVCPIGLTLATFVLVCQFIQFNEITWGLVVFPAILILETVLLRKWCMKICPLGALMSFVSKANKTFRPTVDQTTCLRESKGSNCSACAKACPELIDPIKNRGTRPMNECVKCHRCADACPMHAISFPFIPKK